jgi:VWFA-related protein
MRRSRRSLPLVVGATYLAAAAALGAQRFTSTTSLLTLDVSVLDKDGNPVSGLAPEDLTVTLNGEVRPVSAMVFLANQNVANAPLGRGASAKSRPSLLATGNGSEPDPRLVVILVDDMSIYPTDSKSLFVSAERFLNAIPPRDWVGLTTTSGRVTVNPSLDRALVLQRMKRMFGWMNDPRREGQVFVGLIDAQLIDSGSETALREVIERGCGLTAILASKSLAQILAEYECANKIQLQARTNAAFARATTRNQLDLYIAVINAMAPAPGVKQLVILTGGVALPPVDSLEFVRVAKAAAAAGVQISMLAEEPEATDMSLKFAEYAQDQRQMLQEAQTLAETSGGQFFRVIGQADRFYQRILTSASAIYRIGVDLPKSVPPDGKYNVVVKVNRPGVKVLATRYAAPPVPPVASTPAERMQHAIKTGEPSYEVPVQMLAESVLSKDGSKTEIRVVIDVPGDAPGPVSGMFGIVGPDHQLRSGHQNLARSNDGRSYHLDFLVPAAAATYDLRFAVASANGAVGAVSQKLVVK